MLTVFRERRARAIVAATLMFAQGCYTFLPVGSGVNPPVGQLARVHLTPDGTLELARYLGPNVVRAEGTVAAMSDEGTMALRVEYVELANDVRQPWSGEGVVNIPAVYRREVHQRVFQKRRSIVAGTLLGLGLVSLAVIALRGIASGEGGVEVPPPTP
jgi:hypothetical protein